jgi:hypothetical protein
MAIAYVIAEPCMGPKNAACVDASPVDCVHPKKITTCGDGRPTFDVVSQFYIGSIAEKIVLLIIQPSGRCHD